MPKSQDMANFIGPKLKQFGSAHVVIVLKILGLNMAE